MAPNPRRLCALTVKTDSGHRRNRKEAAFSTMGIREAKPNKSVNRTFYSGPTYGGFAIFTSGRATVKRRLPKR